MPERLYRPSEKDWPTLLHMTVATRRKEGTTAWMRFIDTTPPNAVDERLYVSLSAPEWTPGVLALTGYAETMIKQLLRQHDLRQALNL